MTEESLLQIKVSNQEKEAVENLSKQCNLDSEQLIRLLLFETGIISSGASQFEANRV